MVPIMAGSRSIGRRWGRKVDKQWVRFFVAALAEISMLHQSVWAQAPVQVARASGGTVVSASTLASQVGRNVLVDGGNAVDAAVATAFALAVTWPEAGNIGGGGFMLIVPHDQTPVVVDYREVAPLVADRYLYKPHESRYSLRAVATPGTVKGLAVAHRRFGRLPWKRLVQPAVQLAREGFVVDAPLARSLNEILHRADIQMDPHYAELRRVYGKADGRAWREGDRLVLPELADTLELLAEQGEEAFYRGAIAEKLVRLMETQGGLIGSHDLESYEALVRTPVQFQYRDYTILAPPPPSSGGTCLSWILGMVEPLNLRQQPRYSPDTVHVLTEAMRRAFSERARFLGDPSFWPIPAHITTSGFIRTLSQSIDRTAATPSEKLLGQIELVEEPAETTHFSIIDSQGMAVANTYTLEASYGSGIVVPGAGFLLNNEMGDFNWYPSQTNRQGQIGTRPNQIAPGKRMLSSQTPTVVLYQGQPILITGSPGGRTIINTVATILLNVLEYQMDLPTAVAHPRMHHQWFPDELVLEEAPQIIDEHTIAALRRMGHRVVIRRSPQGSAHSIWIDPRTRERIGVADLRRSGAAIGTTIEAGR